VLDAGWFGSGKPLAAPMREFMESRFQADFRQVRVYSSPVVDYLTAALGTSAFTFGDRIFCSSTLNNCSEWTYRYVFAHELAHVLQKRAESQAMATINSYEIELEAHLSAFYVMQGRSVPPLGPDSAKVIRCWSETGHYYTVYFVAVAAGIDPKTAAKYAFFAQLPDMVLELDAESRGYDIWNCTARNSWKETTDNQRSSNFISEWKDLVVQEGLHCPTGRESKRETSARATILQESLGDPMKAGLAAHAFGDSFAHRMVGDESRMYGPGLGHAIEIFRGNDPHLPDHLDHRPSLYADYGQALYRLFRTVADESRVQVSEEELRNRLGTLAKQRGPEKEKINSLRTSLRKDSKDSISNFAPERIRKTNWNIFRGTYANLVAGSDLNTILGLATNWVVASV
jgi:hypothetical protein